MDYQKALFLEKYNTKRSVGIALSSAIKAAVQHNSLYAKNVNEQTRISVRNAWREQLNLLVEDYKNARSESEYEKDIEELKKFMNNNFSNVFSQHPHPIFHTDAGFRISHAQKSISVFLKHLWCMGKIEMPPQCPVDSIVLRKANYRYPNTKWGYINSIETHHLKIELLKTAANGNPLAEWELSIFNV